MSATDIGYMVTLLKFVVLVAVVYAVAALIREH